MRALDIAAIIVTYRTAELTVAALCSLERERSGATPGLRAIVIDNASGDAPRIERAIHDARWSSWVRLVCAPRNGGFAYGNNLGVHHAWATARPDYVYLLNPDAEVRPGAVAALAEFLETHGDIGIAGSSFENADGSDWPIAFRFPSIWSELCQGVQIGLLTRALGRWEVAMRMTRDERRVDWICGASMLIRPSVFAAIGGFDEGYFLYFEETDFCRRARAAGFPTAYVPQSRVMHIMGQSTSVTDSTRGPRRLPAYWFESRRRYFANTFGIAYAMLIDGVALLAYLIGLAKSTMLGRWDRVVPHFIRDLAHHSILRAHNRNVSPIVCRSVQTPSN